MGSPTSRATEPTHGTELWRSDGTSAGTWLVKDINPKPANSSNPDELTIVGHRLFFFANDGTSGNELWVTDGTEAGTVMLADIYPGSTSSVGVSNQPNIVALGDHVLFKANDPVHGVELWQSDGTPSGTVLFRDFNPGTGEGVYSMDLAGGKLWMNAYADGMGGELWYTDGTQGGTTLVKDIFPGYVGSSPYEFTEMNGITFLRASQPVICDELFRTDGTAAGTYMVKEIATDNSTGYTCGSALNSFQAASSYLYFTATTDGDFQHKRLWRSDGTAAGTIQLTLDPASVTDPINEMIAYKDMLLISLWYGTYDRQLWVSHGTPETTTRLSYFSASYAGMYLSNGVVYFQANGELWKTDGTPAGTQLATDVNGTPSPSNPYVIADLGNRLLLSADHAVYGKELWSYPLCDAPPAPQITIDAPVGCGPRSGTASVPSGYAAYSWSISNGSFTSSTDGTSVSFTTTADPARLWVTVKDGTGCPVTSTQQVAIRPIAAPTVSFTR